MKSCKAMVSGFTQPSISPGAELTRAIFSVLHLKINQNIDFWFFWFSSSAGCLNSSSGPRTEKTGTYRRWRTANASAELENIGARFSPEGRHRSKNSYFSGFGRQEAGRGSWPESNKVARIVLRSYRDAEASKIFKSPYLKASKIGFVHKPQRIPNGLKNRTLFGSKRAP
jgi:hypothetical protein